MVRLRHNSRGYAQEVRERFISKTTSAHAGLEGWYDEDNNTDHHNTGRSCNSEEVTERFPC